MTGISWNTAVTDPNGSDLSSITANDYIQFRVNLSTTDINYTPYLYQTDGYVFRLLYYIEGQEAETVIGSIYKTGWKDFGIPGYKKLIKRIKVFYYGTEGEMDFNIRGDDGDIDKTFSIDLSVEPDDSTTDEYTGDELIKVYTFLPPINSATDPSLISQLFRFLIEEDGVADWELYKVEILYNVEEIY